MGSSVSHLPYSYHGASGPTRGTRSAHSILVAAHTDCMPDNGDHSIRGGGAHVPTIAVTRFRRVVHRARPVPVVVHDSWSGARLVALLVALLLLRRLLLRARAVLGTLRADVGGGGDRVHLVLEGEGGGERQLFLLLLLLLLLRDVHLLLLLLLLRDVHRHPGRPHLVAQLLAISM